MHGMALYEKVAANRALEERPGFAGKLVPQDPGDEPAEKLLERIKSDGKNRAEK